MEKTISDIAEWIATAREDADDYLCSGVDPYDDELDDLFDLDVLSSRSDQIAMVLMTQIEYTEGTPVD